MFVVSRPHGPTVPSSSTSIYITKERHRPRSISESSIYECVKLCDAHIYGLYLWYVMAFRMKFLSVTHHVHTHIHTYILCENRSLIQSLVLMRSAIMSLNECTVISPRSGNLALKCLKSVVHSWFFREWATLQATNAGGPILG